MLLKAGSAHMAKNSKLASKASEIVEYRPKPTLRIDAKDLPEIKDWKIGKTYTLTVQARMIAISDGDEYSDFDDDRRKSPVRATFRIIKVKDNDKY